MLERTLALFREELGFAPPVSAPPAEGKRGLAAFLRAAGARVIVPDMRGFGNSDQPADPASYADAAMARDVAALIEHLGLESVDVCGFSMGSLTAAKLLALGPAAVRSAVLAGVGDDILEGEVMDLPQQWPLPEHLPRPLTLRGRMRRKAPACWIAARSNATTCWRRKSSWREPRAPIPGCWRRSCAA